MRLLFVSLLCFIILNGCVTNKKFKTQTNDLINCRSENKELENSVLNSQHEKMNALEMVDETNLKIALLEKDSIATHTLLASNNKLLAELQDANAKLLAEKNELINNSSSKNQQLSGDLLQKQTELESKQRELENKELSNSALTNELRVRMQKVKELESILNAKDSATLGLKKRIADALQSFDNSELTVERKNGKVYVSLSEKLLFKPGSTAVDPKGKDALKKLAEVLNKNLDIFIAVEGHTDNAPFSHENYPKDNWDLSVLRATTIVKILESNDVDPKRITASGHGAFYPITENNSKANKSANRRTEIILTPRLDELIKVLESN
jgi:chemotaxis protein MotB